VFRDSLLCSEVALETERNKSKYFRNLVNMLKFHNSVSLFDRLNFKCKSPILFTKMTNKMQLCRIIYCSLAALRVSSDIFAHHQKHLNCIYSFCYYSHVSLPADVEAG